MDFYAALVTVLMRLWGHEAGVGEIDNRWEDKKPEVEQLSKMFVETAKSGDLVDPQTDAMILATLAWYESRIMLKPPDGDVMHLHEGNVGTAVGPMQINKAAPYYVVQWPGGERWKGLDVAKMRDPATNIELAYFNLKFRKDTCGGPPGVWIAAYGMGKCPKKWGQDNYSIGWEGKRRCKTLTRLMKKLAEKGGYTMPTDWSCSAPKAGK
jgi:hypothetical protein